MKTGITTILKYSLLFVLALGIRPLLPGQTVKKYEGEYSRGGLKGTGEFSYYISKGDTILNGPFRLQKAIPAGADNGFNIISIEGGFRRDIPDGTWQIHKGRFAPVGKGVFKDYSFVFQVEGSEVFVRGDMRNGKVNGIWQIFEWNIKGSELKDTIMSASLPFKEDLVSGKFRFSERMRTLEGEISNGFPQGKWIYSTAEKNIARMVKEEWIFEDYQLAVINLFKDGKTHSLNIANQMDLAIPEDIELSEKYFRIIDLKASLDKNEAFRLFRQETPIRKLYTVAMEKFHHTDSLLTPVSGKSIKPVIKARVEKFPYTGQERTQLQKIKSDAAEVAKLTSEIQEDAQINIAKLSIPRVAFYSAALNSIESNLLQPVSSLIRLYDNNDLEYVPRGLFISGNIRFDTVLTVAVKINKESVNEDYHLKHIRIDRSKQPLEQLAGFTASLLQEVQTINDSLQLLLHEIKKEKKLVALEEKLISEQEEVNKLADSILTLELRALAGFDVQNSISAFLEAEISNYSRLPSADKKVQQIDPLLECINQAKRLIFTLENVPDKYKIIETAYTQQVFNPYTYTYMEDKIKEPIYKAYKNLILPALLQNLQDLNCGKVAAYNDNFKILFDGMIGFLEKDTRKIERKIKRVSDPHKAAQMLNLNLVF